MALTDIFALVNTDTLQVPLLLATTLLAFLLLWSRLVQVLSKRFSWTPVPTEVWRCPRSRDTVALLMTSLGLVHMAIIYIYDNTRGDIRKWT